MFDFPPLTLQFVGALLPSFSDEIVGAVLGAFLAFLFSWMLHRWAEKKSRALELIQEYSSPDFIDIRNDAGQALRTSKDPNSGAYPSWQELFDRAKAANDEGRWRKISKMKHFYEKLDYMVSIREVNQKYISGYFHEEFTHWNQRYFAPINAASKASGQPEELDVSTLVKHLKDPQATWFWPCYITLRKPWSQ